MPIYTYDCPQHGEFDVIRPLSACDEPTYACETCSAESPRTIEMCAVQPDSFWHFGRFDHRTKTEVNSRSKMDKMNRSRNIVELNGRADREAMEKVAEQGARDVDARLAKESLKAMENAFAGTGVLNSDGEVRPEALRAN